MSPGATTRALLLGALVALSAAGCDHAPPPSAPVIRPILERPLASVDAATQPVTVPGSVITQRGGIPGVFVLSDGLARFRMVKPGKKHGDRVQIISGLTGDEVLVAGDLREVHDGSPITPAGN
jgi:multidrug efflux pump subunit AcrA (membrane-fusion protein)